MSNVPLVYPAGRIGGDFAINIDILDSEHLLGDTVLHSLLVHGPEVDVAVAIALRLLLLRMLLLLLDVGRGRVMGRNSVNSANIRIPWKMEKMLISVEIFLP